jgi:peptidyl-prolyl cis-trans isomerase B (cyclophilin B)
MRIRVFHVLLYVSLITAVAFGQEDPKKANSRPNPTPTPAGAKPEPFDKADIKTMAGQCVRLDTEAGIIELEMYPEQAPETVRNFLNLVATGVYDTTTFSRIVPGFVIQGGNLSTREGPWTNELAARARKTIPDEPNKILHQPGVLSMARPDEPNSATTHFFILVSEAPDLDGKFAAFGRVTKGMDVVQAINKAPVTGDKPEKPVRVKKATVFACAPPQP